MKSYSRRALFRRAIGVGVLAVGWGRGWEAKAHEGHEHPEVLVNLVYPEWSDWKDGSGSVVYRPVSDKFEAALQIQGLKPSHPYQAIAQAISFQATNQPAVSSSFETDAEGGASLTVTLPGEDLAVDPDRDLPVYQVHVLLLDPEETSPSLSPPGPLGIAVGIPLACEYPLGFALQPKE